MKMNKVLSGENAYKLFSFLLKNYKTYAHSKIQIVVEE